MNALRTKLIISILLIGISGLVWSDRALAQDNIRLEFDGAGYQFGWITLNLSELSIALENQDYPALPNGLFLHGLAGNFGGNRDLRFGGVAAFGAISKLEGQVTSRISMGFGGLFVKHRLPFDLPFELSAGATLGAGSATLYLSRSISESFEDSLANPADTTLNRGFLVVEPFITSSYNPLPWLRLRLTLGYLLALGSPWAQGENELPGPPDNLSSLVIHFGGEFGGASR